jgi:ribonuclease P protein component
MKHTVSIKENREFLRLYRKGKFYATPYLVVYFRRAAPGGNKLGITVGTKLGKAVVRNKIKRRLREIYRLREDRVKTGIHLVIVARTKGAEASYQTLEKAFDTALRKLGLWDREKKETI